MPAALAWVAEAIFFTSFVIPGLTGDLSARGHEIPACAGMTGRGLPSRYFVIPTDRWGVEGSCLVIE